MSNILPNLIHPVDVEIQQISRVTTVYDEDAREPIQAASRSSTVVVQGQPSWGASRRLEATGAGPVDNAQGYVLFRVTDLATAGVALQINDRLRFQGRELYIVRLQPAGHYGGVSKLTRAYFADREPAKTPAPAPRLLRPDDVEGLIGWFRSDIVDVDAGLVAAWPDQSGSGNDFFQNSISRRPTYVSAPPPLLRFDETQLHNLASASKMNELFGNRPPVVLAVCSLSGAAPDGIFGSLLTTLPAFILEDTAPRYGSKILSFPRTTAKGVRVLWHDGTSIIYRLNGEEKDKGAAAISPLGLFQSSTYLGFARSQPYSGDFYELLLYSRSPGLYLTEIQGLELYLKARHGIA